MVVGKSLLPPKYKRRKVSAVRDFPKGLKRFPDFLDLKSRTGQACELQDEYLKGTGLQHILSSHDTQNQEADRIVGVEGGVLQLGIKLQCGVAVEEVIHNNPKGLKRLSEDIDPKTKGDEPCGSKNASEFEESFGELDPKLKGDETCGSKNESLKPIELKEASIDYEREVDFEMGELQLGTKQRDGNGDENRVLGLKKKPPCMKFGDFFNSGDCVIDGLESRREEQPQLDSEQVCGQFSCLQQRCAYDNDNVVGSKESMKCQDIGTSLNSCNLPSNPSRKLPKRRKISAIRDFPPALVRVIPMNRLHRYTNMSGGAINNLDAVGHAYQKSETVGECFETDVENEKDLDLLKNDDFSHSKANEGKESSFNSGKELLVDKVASTDHLGIAEGSCSDIVSSSDDANMLEPKYGINNVEIDVEKQFMINDEPRLDLGNREFYHPSGHNSSANNDVQESTYLLDAPDDMFSLAPADVADFFSDDCHNGFLFEDYVEPSDTNNQSAWQDGSEELVIKTADDIGTMDHGIKAIADSGDDEQRLQPNDNKNEVSKRNKSSISGKQKEDVCSLFIPQKKPSCKTAHGSSQQKFPGVGGSVPEDKSTKYRTGEAQVKKVHREVTKLEGGGTRVGKVKYMPKEACKALEKRNHLPSVKIYKTAPMSSSSEKIAGRVIVQGLMAAKRCPWRHSRK